MTFETWLTRFDPNQLGLSAFFIVLTFGTLMFIWRKVWPWYTTVYYPAKIEMEKYKENNRFIIEREQNQVMMAIRDAMIEIKTVLGTMVGNFDNHDRLMNNFFIARTEHDINLDKRLDTISDSIFDTRPMKAVKAAAIKSTRPKKVKAT